MTREANRTTISGPLGDCIVIERGEYLVRDGARTVRSFSGSAAALAYAKAYVGTEPPVVVKVAPAPPKTVDTRATLSKKVEAAK